MTKSRPKPTAAELELLNVLWERGPSTVRQIHEVLAASKQTGYTTTLKILQKMTARGLVVRDESRRSHVYRAAVQAESTRRRLVDELIEKAFGGAAAQLVMQVLSSRPVDPDEIERLRRLLDELEEKSP